MKKKIIIGFILFSIIFFVGGIYIIFTIERSTSELNNLITLHQVGILRDHLLIQMKRVQSDLSLHNTRYARGVDSLVSQVSNLEKIVDTCFDCHHPEAIARELVDLKKKTERYKYTLSRVFTVRANTKRLEVEEDVAFRLGEQIITRVNDMIYLARMRLDQKTEFALKEISKTKTLIYFLVVLGPLLAMVLAVMIIRMFMKPVNSLLKATRKVKTGNFDYRITGLKDEFGEVAGSFNDMAASLKEHIHKMIEGEKRYRMLFEGAGDAIFILDAEGENVGRIVSANHAAAEMHGYTLDELLDMEITELDTPDAAKGAPERIQRILNGEIISAEINHLKKDGTAFPIELSAGLLEFENHKYIFAFDKDITERKRAQLVLQQSLDFQQMLIDTIPVPVFYKDVQGRYLGCNKPFEDFIGMKREEIIGKSVYDISPREFADSYDEKDRELFDNPGIQVYESSVKDRDGEIHYVIFNKATFRNPDGQVGGLIGAINDITERKRAEEAMQRTEQMVACGELSTRLAHEIKNPLAGIKLSMEVLSEEPEFSEEDRDVLGRVVDEVQRIEELLKSLLNFSRPPKPQLAHVDVSDVLKKSLTFMQKYSSTLLKRSEAIRIVTEYEEGLPEIMADPMQLQQIFLNLFLNAADAMPGGGTLAVRAFRADSENTLQIEVSDTGKGIGEESPDKLFKPFYTSKPKGTGLGLTITKQLVEQHDGVIEVSNNDDGGATFQIRLPIEKKTEETSKT
jgi:PAS domain S-box-containing protein